MNFRYADNTSDFLEPGSGGKAVAKWDTTCPSQLRVGCDVTKAGNAARPRGRQPEGVRNAKKSPQNKHSHRRRQTLIATTLCAVSQLTGHNLHKVDHLVTLLCERAPDRRSRGPWTGNVPHYYHTTVANPKVS